MDEKFIGYLLSESNPIDAGKPKILFDNGHVIRFKSLIQDGNSLNRNKRIYPTDVISEAIRHEHVVEKMSANAFLGEMNHPMEKTVERQTFVDGNNASHIIKSVEQRGDCFYGIIETTANQVGTDYMNMIKYNDLRAAFSMRGLAAMTKKKFRPQNSYKEEMHNVIVSPLRIICYDAVTIPSHRNAYMELSESLIIGFSHQEACDLMMMSENFNVFHDFIGTDPLQSKVSLTENCQVVEIETNTGSKARILIESHIQDVLKDFYKKI